MKCFNGFCQEGVVQAETVGEILQMMGLRVKQQALQAIIEEVDEDGSGELEFEEFCILAARFLIEEDEEQMRKELKEAFRFYDKEEMEHDELKNSNPSHTHFGKKSFQLTLVLIQHI
uniref:Troponin C, isoform 1like [Megachile rotundata] n=1 Tax=Lepeophtheirus salmonis TaxID=72036 RepID=A0A0K2UCN3_LEPSM